MAKELDKAILRYPSWLSLSILHTSLKYFIPIKGKGPNQLIFDNIKDINAARPSGSVFLDRVSNEMSIPYKKNDYKLVSKRSGQKTVARNKEDLHPVHLAVEAKSCY